MRTKFSWPSHPLYSIKITAVLAGLLLLNIQHIKIQQLLIILAYAYLYTHPPFKSCTDGTLKKKSFKAEYGLICSVNLFKQKHMETYHEKQMRGVNSSNLLMSTFSFQVFISIMLVEKCTLNASVTAVFLCKVGTATTITVSIRPQCAKYLVAAVWRFSIIKSLLNFWHSQWTMALRQCMSLLRCALSVWVS